jgi:Protein of unknown function (DUF2961)
MVQHLRCYLVLSLLAFLVTSASRASEITGDAPAARRYYLDDLYLAREYVPGKQSFLFQKLKKGGRRVILNLTGSGSVRHIWSTWSLPLEDHRIVLSVYVDGQPVPAISGTIAELCLAAQQTGERYVPFPAFIYKGSYNIYLPIFFGRSIRIEIQALDDCDEFYAQIDYRLTPGVHNAARLISHLGTLKYTSWTHHLPRLAEVHTVEATPPDGELVLQGPAILRMLSFHGGHLEDLYLTIYWDDDSSPAVRAPLRYFFADFNNAAIETTNDDVRCYFPMPFARRARIVLRDASGQAGHIVIRYAAEKLPALPKGALYFHARYNEASTGTTGYEQYHALQIHGAGHFVGINLFDTGSNHGGGDAALIDAGSATPRVLHGICGEDYFSFAWHNTGTMTPLTGAPVNARRYRLHFENPYPFRESFQFLFGEFAGLHPKSVGFWYQAGSPNEHVWAAVDVPWYVLGPVNPAIDPSATPDDRVYESSVNVAVPRSIRARWQEAEMRGGFLDLTYHFRNYIMTRDGNGFVAGRCHFQLISYINAASRQDIEAMIGQDDGAELRVNGYVVARLPEHVGFHASLVKLPLRKGRNILCVALSNDDNVDWRWAGLSFAIRSNMKGGLTFD